MNLGRTVFSQLVDFLPAYQFQICVDRYQGNRYVKDFSCWDQFLCLAFAQLTYRESLRDIEACLRAQQPKLYHMGFRLDCVRTAAVGEVPSSHLCKRQYGIGFSKKRVGDTLSRLRILSRMAASPLGLLTV